MTRPALEVADIFRQYGASYQAHHPLALRPEQARVIRALSICRTAELGGHVDGCAECGHQQISYNSCRNRHCPKCQSQESGRWLAKQRANLLPIPYFHLVFTLPEELSALALQNRRVVYNLLFQAVNCTLRTIAADPRHLGAEIGCLAVLHTWGEQLQHHPHLHCIVTGGGLSSDQRQWKSCLRRYFLPVKVLSRLFRRLFLEGLEEAFSKARLGFDGRLVGLQEALALRNLIRKLQHKEWVVYAKEAFGSAEQVLRYLGRYTHRVAISNERILSISEGKVSFRWKDYRHSGQRRVLCLSAEEFIRRFLLHLIPRGFQRIRHYGLLSNRRGKAKLEQARRLLGSQEKESQVAGDYRQQYQELTGRSLEQCPLCGSNNWRRVEWLAPLVAEELRVPCEAQVAQLDSS